MASPQKITAASIDDEEVAQFSAIADEWWDPNGKFRPLHQINPLRLDYIRTQALAHFQREDKPGALKELSLLDIGCGGGLLAEPLAKQGADVTAIDASEKNIKVASLHATQSGVPVDYLHTSVEALATEGRQFDVVLNMEVVEHVADIESFMQAACQCVKPGGLMVLATLNRTAKSFLFAIVGAEYVLRWLPRGTHDWKKFLTPAEVSHHFRNYGMQVEETKGMNMHPLNFEWSLSARDASVNYLMLAKKPE